MAMSNRTMLPAILKAERVIPRKLKMAWPIKTKKTSTPAATRLASRAMRTRSATVLLGVMAKKAGTLAIGSIMTKSDVAASNVYSRRLISCSCERIYRTRATL